MLTRLIKFARENNFLFVIVILAVSLRLFSLSENPPSLNWDEVSHGYNAYSILKTGRDEWGNFLPSIFRAYGDYKLPVYVYATSVSELFFGLSAFAVRFPSALAGVATVIFTYLLAKELFDKKVAIFSSLLVSIEPWSLFLSRGAFEANLALAFIVAGVYFFVRSFHTSSYFLLLSSFFLGLSVWTYNSARIFVPLFLLVSIFAYKRELGRIWRTNVRLATCNLLLIGLFFLPMFWQLVSPAGQARYSWVSIIDEGAVSQINNVRASSGLNPFLARLLYNKATYFTADFAKNWASSFSGDFLFFKGGDNFQFSVPGYGLLYPINLIFLILGVILLIKKRSSGAFLVLAWFYLGPIAASLTRESPHALRSITMLPAPMLLTSYGVVYVWDRLRKNLRYVFLIGYFVILGGFLEAYLATYFNSYRDDYSWSWQYGYRQVVNYVREHYGEYDKIIVSKRYGEAHEFFLFYWPWDPKSYQSDGHLIRFYQSNWYWVDRFDNFYFVNDWEVPRKDKQPFILESRKETVHCTPTTEHCLLIASPGNYPQGWKKLETINFLDGSPAFEILDN